MEICIFLLWAPGCFGNGLQSLLSPDRAIRSQALVAPSFLHLCHNPNNQHRKSQTWLHVEFIAMPRYMDPQLATLIKTCHAQITCLTTYISLHGLFFQGFFRWNTRFHCYLDRNIDIQIFYSRPCPKTDLVFFSFFSGYPDRAIRL